jgi:cytoskeletal protein RodZ
VSIGEVLATARRQAGLTTAQVSQRTRIREGIVRGIEAGDFSACGGDFYARGHIRAIARSVGHRPRAAGPGVRLQPQPTQARAAASGPAPSAPLRLTQRRRPHWGIALLVVLAAVVGLVTYRFGASGPAGSSTAAAHKPAATAHKPARTWPRRTPRHRLQQAIPHATW